ncbi:MAG TPA: hypothetical protein VGL66_08925 [Caulobacteraceae bacterium]|jgi:hypothetical protein
MAERIEVELETMAVVLSALQKLESPATQTRVVKWVLEKLNLATQLESSRPQTPLDQTPAPHTHLAGAPTAAQAWLKQNGLTSAELELVFHVDGPEGDVIAAEVPGKSNRERSLNCYLLEGARALLKGGDAAFSDKAARTLCVSLGCFDNTNHSKYLSGRGNEFTGSKEKGWVLTGPGKKRAAALVREIASNHA